MKTGQEPCKGVFVLRKQFQQKASQKDQFGKLKFKMS